MTQCDKIIIAANDQAIMGDMLAMKWGWTSIVEVICFDLVCWEVKDESTDVLMRCYSYHRWVGRQVEYRALSISSSVTPLGMWLLQVKEEKCTYMEKVEVSGTGLKCGLS